MISLPELFLQFLKKSRRRPQAGDIFCFKILSDCYHFGRVICNDATMGPSTGNVLLLLYFYTSSSPSPHEVPKLSRDQLLIPPVLTVHRAWLDGYFMTVGNRPVTSEDRLPVNCFYWDFGQEYRDEYDQLLPCKFEPCGQFVIAGYGAIAQDLARALGLHVTIDDEDEDTSIAGWKLI